MTMTDPTQTDGPRRSAEEMRDLTGLRRHPSEKMIAGVASGIARHLDIDPLVVRITLAVLTFLGGAGLIIYVAGWLFLPTRDGEVTGPAMVDLDPRSRVVIVWAAVGIAVLAMIRGSFSNWNFPWWPLAGALIFIAVVSLQRRSGTRGSGGPLLFWFGVGLAAVALGALGVVDLSGADIVASAYPALALAVIGAMLLLGAFWGRAGGLILVGLLAMGALGVTTVVERFEGRVGDLHATPTDAALVEDSYQVRVGDVVLDLTQVSDLEELDGRTVEVVGGLATVEVIVPGDLAVTVEATSDRLGSIDLFGQQTDGWQAELSGGIGAGDGLHLDLSVGVGEIIVRSK
ncbi:MAG: PspC domain-containing protein [Nocardioides sp.]